MKQLILALAIALIATSHADAGIKAEWFGHLYLGDDPVGVPVVLKGRWENYLRADGEGRFRCKGKRWQCPRKMRRGKFVLSTNCRYGLVGGFFWKGKKNKCFFSTRLPEFTADCGDQLRATFSCMSGEAGVMELGIIE